jgi:hypothetical protein
MGFKVGDKVLVKDLDWYNKNKDNKDDVLFSSLGPVFTRSHSNYAGRVMTIEVVSKLGFYVLKEDKEGNTWYDEMFEGLADSIEDRMKELRKMCTISLNDSNYTDKIEVLINDYEYVEEDGKVYFVKKKKGYPDTYEECCKVLDWNHRDYDRVGYKSELLCKLQVLLLCRDAYWKIAGEELGLEGPWEPDHRGTFEHGTPIKYVIYNIGTHIVKERKSSPNHILSFPTEEMAYAFYEAFQKEIEICKELL